MGSVKDLKILESPQENKPGIGQFNFSDRYSVFDWGEMPDLITDKGKSLCMMSAYFFEELEKLGIKTHYQGVVENGEAKKITEISSPVDVMQVSLVRVLKPEMKDGQYDYSIYTGNEKNILIPLEVIYRNSLPAGSSVFKRLKDGSLSLEEMGLDSMPAPNDIMKNPILDASTKLEITDRYFSWDEAQKISAISSEELAQIKSTTSRINNVITEKAQKAGLVNEDGKVEYAFDENRQLILVDVLGTPDECRFTFSDIPVSKEIARVYYRKLPWYEEVEAAKNEDRLNWKKLVKNPPPVLPDKLFKLVSQLYQGACNEITQREWFDTPPLKSILEDLKEYI